MNRAFIDVNIPMYAAGVDHPLVEPSRRVMAAVASGQIDAVTDAEVFQEILYRYFHIGQKEKGLRVFDHFFQIMLGRILPIEDLDVQQARELADRYPALSPRDLVHLAVIVRQQIEDVITADTTFEGVHGVQRIDPAAFA